MDQIADRSGRPPQGIGQAVSAAVAEMESDGRTWELLELEHVHKRYSTPGEVIHAVRDLTLTVRERELVALLGPSGSGKSTLLMLAAGLLRADEGAVRFEGRDLATLGRRDALAHRRTQLGFVFQSFNLTAGLTAQENVAIPLLMRGIEHRQAHRRAAQALCEVGLAHRLDHVPQRLSGGECQRVAIARALVGQPKLILADEPTGNLDSETASSVLELLGTLPARGGAAVILVTHDERAAARADRVLSMRDGMLLTQARGGAR